MAPSADASATVSEHYDRLDLWYRSLWGAHLHHGLWFPETREPSEASRNLLETIAEAAGLSPGMSICDVGCGYGGPACWLANRESVTVTGITNSSCQVEHAERRPNVKIRHGDWLENGFPARSFDVVVAIESLPHFQDPAHALREMLRVVKSDGKIVVACWVLGPGVGKWAQRWLIRPICRTGCLPGLVDYATLGKCVSEGGGREEKIRFFGKQARRFWSCSLKRSVRLLLTDRALRQEALRHPFQAFRLGVDAVRIWISYRLGILDYVVLAACPRER